MPWTFFDNEGYVDIDGNPEWPGFTQALRDSVGSDAPRGRPPGLSTYWIDELLMNLAANLPPDTVEASGNETDIERIGDEVHACSDYEMFEDEIMPLDDLVELLTRWRAEVQQRLDAEDPAVRAERIRRWDPNQWTPQRNPHGPL